MTEQNAEPVVWMNSDHIEAFRKGKTDGIAWASPGKTEFYDVALYASPQWQPTIKPLEWVARTLRDKDGNPYDWYASSYGGWVCYSIRRRPDGTCILQHFNEASSVYGNLEIAKATAQADHERRVRSALLQADASERQADSIELLIRALEPFAKIAGHDIGEDEADTDLFRPMSRFNRVPPLTVGDLRRAYSILQLVGNSHLRRECTVCGADCGSANPPAYDCPKLECCDLACPNPCPGCPCPSPAVSEYDHGGAAK